MEPRITHEYFTFLFSRNLIPLRVVVGAIALGFYDHLLMLDDEVKYVWRRKKSLGRLLFFWIRYYTLALLLFDLLQIHLFAIPGVANAYTCVLMDPITRVVGAISLWSVQIYMQLRIFALYNRSKKVALFNGVLFILSIGSFLWLMVINAMRRGDMIKHALNLPLPGCPTINNGLQWALWIPPCIFEFNLFLFALAQAVSSSKNRLMLNGRASLTTILLGDNILYFFSVTVLLVFNNLMSVASTHIPWFGMAPFHAILGIVTGRIMITVYKYADKEGSRSSQDITKPLAFAQFEHAVSSPLVPSGEGTRQESEETDSDDDGNYDPTTPMLSSGTLTDIEANAATRSLSRRGSFASAPASTSRPTRVRRLSLLSTCAAPGPARRRLSIV